MPSRREDNGLRQESHPFSTLQTLMTGKQEETFMYSEYTGIYMARYRYF